MFSFTLRVQGLFGGYVDKTRPFTASGVRPNTESPPGATSCATPTPTFEKNDFRYPPIGLPLLSVWRAFPSPVTPITPGTSTGMTTHSFPTGRVTGVVLSGLVASVVG